MKRLRSKKTLSEEQLIKTVNYLLFFASACLFYGITYLVTDNEIRFKEYKDKVDVGRRLEMRPEPFTSDIFDYLNNRTMPVFETVTNIETEYLGEYFVTAYASAELGGSTATASGAECHYHDEWYIPTTAAIDPKYHSFNEYLMIDGKIYVTEDTGSGVKGRWVDCYVPDMESVWSWDTGWKSVYQVTFTEKTIKTGEVKIYDDDNGLYNAGICDRSFLRNGSGAPCG